MPKEIEPKAFRVPGGMAVVFHDVGQRVIAANVNVDVLDSLVMDPESIEHEPSGQELCIKVATERRSVFDEAEAFVFADANGRGVFPTAEAAARDINRLLNEPVKTGFFGLARRPK